MGAGQHAALHVERLHTHTHTPWHILSLILYDETLVERKSRSVKARRHYPLNGGRECNGRHEAESKRNPKFVFTNPSDLNGVFRRRNNRIQKE